MDREKLLAWVDRQGDRAAELYGDARKTGGNTEYQAGRMDAFAEVEDYLDSDVQRGGD